MSLRQSAAEFFGTFALVFAGTGAIVINTASQGVITHAGVALTFGLMVLAMIYTIGDISGAHLNPAVTVGFFAARRFPGRAVVPYVTSQLLGATTASLLLRFLFPQDQTLGMTLPAAGLVVSFIFEVVLTLILMWVILSVSTGAQEKGITAGIAVGSVIALEGMFAAPICGASMNPARSFGPALVSLRFDGLWIYFAATTLGALLAVPLCRLIRGPECCGPNARATVSDRPVSDRTGILRS
ncbi:MAG TPA: aquaporin [Chthoniobacterales bacterium]|jgi:aquaporin Z